jgi:hypothetical protein
MAANSVGMNTKHEVAKSREGCVHRKGYRKDIE